MSILNFWINPVIAEIIGKKMDGNMNFKNNNLGNEPPGDGGGGGGLTRQGSIYSLTFDEFQRSLGKDFGSMNMDELLKNIWSAEETQAMASGVVPVVGGGQEGLQLQRQGSLTLPRTLSQKTVDQVWKDLSKVGNSRGEGTNLSQVAQAQSQSQGQRQQTLGEVTLEEFLVRAGVVREEAQIAENNKGGYFGNDANTGFSVEFQQPSPRVVAAGVRGKLGAETANHLQVQGSSLPLNVNGARSTYQQPQQQQPIMPKQPGFGYGTQMGQLNSPGIRGVGRMGLGDQSLTNNMGLVQGAAAAIPGALGVGAVSPVTPLSSEGIGKSNGDSSSLSPSPYMFNGGVRGRKSGTVEKVVERRQRRMIKNRESAARSRARKQAYTVELEAEVAKLKEENDELQRKQARIMEMQKNQEMEMRNLLQGGPKKKLRRTESGPW
ncbi:ABSCISIC ACID-INSENSITIVE 5-like protein 5 isoform X1 [Arabidopsis lyrata subsp. lyrata]|uniref:ABSCISIC ACID-INSENSITIVE 5-like protein 5 isoform X1 n=2 Tax=Arabidopsis lyrata subsp. lyrata TaxID=81972 RepID=UPI000A29A491|nr:ABSCISIC ACID-INSENSITIVE 5-like protein 5 isoform X1 [Arabidopsis lyrata subsp. lyrata]|eukprot:XP_020869071.1 ABSCISIC ACID-INSENSITIVE 5-like protein 5 isoform X1 [Arabidopsis lyrata subsp. lyrata]